MNEVHTFFRDGLNFSYGEGWMEVRRKGKKIFRTIDTHFKTDDDVYDFYQLFGKLVKNLGR